MRLGQGAKQMPKQGLPQAALQLTISLPFKPLEALQHSLSPATLGPATMFYLLPLPRSKPLHKYVLP